MSNDPTQPMTKKLNESDSAPSSSSRKLVKFLIATALTATLLFLSGLTLTGTAATLVMATPVLVLFSPILVPFGIIIFLVVTGFFFSGGFGVAAITALLWIYNYGKGKLLDYARNMIGSMVRRSMMELADYARNMIGSIVRSVMEMAKEYVRTICASQGWGGCSKPRILSS